MALSVTLVQLDIVWEDKSANHDRIRSLLEADPPPGGGLVILPEMFDTGFSMRTERTTQGHEKSLLFLSQLALASASWVVASMPWPAGAVDEDGAAMCTNRCFVHGPDGGLVCTYDKVHPFSYGREPERFVGGKQVHSFDAGGLCVMPSICYDLRFPELYRVGISRGAECLIVIANWPDARHEHWRALLVARAIENQALVIGVNRAGTDPGHRYAGGSMVVGARGDVLAEMGTAEGVRHVELPLEDLRAWRSRFPALQDRRIRCE